MSQQEFLLYHRNLVSHPTEPGVFTITPNARFPTDYKPYSRVWAENLEQAWLSTIVDTGNHEFRVSNRAAADPEQPVRAFGPGDVIVDMQQRAFQLKLDATFAQINYYREEPQRERIIPSPIAPERERER